MAFGKGRLGTAPHSAFELVSALAADLEDVSRALERPSSTRWTRRRRRQERFQKWLEMQLGRDISGQEITEVELHQLWRDWRLRRVGLVRSQNRR